MTGHRPFKELAKRLSPELRARVATQTAALREAMTLEELRKARDLKQGRVPSSSEQGKDAGPSRRRR